MIDQAPCSAKPGPQTAAALVIGNEILDGKVQEQNVRELSLWLGKLGICLRRVVVVPDELAVIASEMRVLSASHNHVFASGGIGPTHDDVTIEAAALAFDAPVVSDPGLRAMVFERFGVEALESHYLLARIPNGCRLVSSPAIKWPTVCIRNVWLLPGPPNIFKLKLEAITTSFRADNPVVLRSVSTLASEFSIFDRLNLIVRQYPEVEIGSYPQFGVEPYITIITFQGVDNSQVQGASNAFAALLRPGELMPG